MIFLIHANHNRKLIVVDLYASKNLTYGNSSDSGAESGLAPASRSLSTILNSPREHANCKGDLFFTVFY